MKKKVNPRRHTVTQADVNRAKKEAQVNAVKAAWAIMFSVLRDKFGWDVEQLQKMWDEVEDLSDSVTQGYVSVADMMQTLEEEAGIHLR